MTSPLTVEVLNQLLPWVGGITGISFFGVLSSMYHNYVVRKYLKEMHAVVVRKGRRR